MHACMQAHTHTWQSAAMLIVKLGRQRARGSVLREASTRSSLRRPALPADVAMRGGGQCGAHAEAGTTRDGRGVVGNWLGHGRWHTQLLRFMCAINTIPSQRSTLLPAEFCTSVGLLGRLTAVAAQRSGSCARHQRRQAQCQRRRAVLRRHARGIQSARKDRAVWDGSLLLSARGKKDGMGVRGHRRTEETRARERSG